MDPAAEAAIGAGNDVLTADDCGIPQNAVGNELRVLDKVGSVADDARHQHLAGRQIRLLPDAPLVLVSDIAGSGVGTRDGLSRNSLDARRAPSTSARIRGDFPTEPAELSCRQLQDQR